MSCQDKVELKLNPEYRKLISDLTIAFLSDEPANFVEYASDFFNKKLDHRNNNRKKTHISVVEVSEEEDNEFRSRRESFFEESFNPEEEEEELFIPDIYPKSEIQRAKIENTLKSILFFKFLIGKEVDQIVDAMVKKNVLENDIVIKEGDFGDFFYIIESGQFEAFIMRDEKTKILKNYVDEGYFGELALIHQTPRAVSIRAVSDGLLWSLDRTTFRKLIVKSEHNKIKNYVSFIKRVPVLKCLTHEECYTLAECLIPKFYKCGDRIVSQGEAGDGMYFLLSGNAKITIRSANFESNIKILSSGDYFGELSLIQKKPRAASVYAVNDVHATFLSLECFERLLGPCIEVMKRNFDEYDEQLRQFNQKSLIIQEKTG